jgi:dienelactone hydrolase
MLAAAAAGGVGVVTASLDGGPRWQVLPLVVGGGLAVLVTVFVRRRRLAVLLGVVSALAVGVGAAAVWAFPPLRLPDPTGSHPVGITELVWRGPPTDCSTSDIVAQVWYPAAAAGGEPAPYLGRDDDEARRVSNALARTFGVPAFLLREAAVGRGRAVTGTPVAAGRFPVVLFSPGDVSIRRQNSALATDLASHGYVVVALDHPCDSALMVEPDGTGVSSRIRSTGNDTQDQANADLQVQVRARQLSSALDELSRQDTGAGPLSEHLDLERVAATGHSLGGAAALRAAAQDRRIDAAVDLDGFPRGPVRLDVPVLILVAGRGTGNADNDARYATAVDAVTTSSPDGRTVKIDGASHLTFTDAPLLLPPVPGLVGSLGRDEAVRMTASNTEQFLSRVLG